MSTVLVGGLEVGEKDGESLKQLVKDRAKATAYEIKQQAWDLAVEGIKSDFSKEWCRKFCEEVNLNSEDKAELLVDTMDLYVAYENKKYTLEECKIKLDEYIQRFITKVYMEEVESKQ